jgi:hypothetical protein
LIDSTGLQVYGAGQWLEAKHGAKSRRKWRKLHLAVDAASGMIVAQTLTDQDADDPSQVGPLLDQIDEPIGQVTADGAYDGSPTYQTIAAHSAGIEGTVQALGGSCRFGKGRPGIGKTFKSLTEPGAERAIIDCATNLEQQIGAVSRPPHLLRFVHASVDQEIGCAFGDRSADTQTGTVPFGVVDQPRGLASEILVDGMKRVPQLARRHALRAPVVLTFEDMHDLADPLDAALGVLRLAVPNAPVQTLDLGDDHSLRRHPVGLVGRQVRSRQLGVLQTHRDMEPV